MKNPKYIAFIYKSVTPFKELLSYVMENLFFKEKI